MKLLEVGLKQSLSLEVRKILTRVGFLKVPIRRKKNQQITWSMNRIWLMLTTSWQDEKEPRARELALCTRAKKKEKIDSLEGGVRKRAETEGKECWEKKERTRGCGAPQCR